MNLETGIFISIDTYKEYGMSLKILEVSTIQNCYHYSIGKKKISCNNYSVELKPGINFIIGELSDKGWLCSYILSKANTNLIESGRFFLNDTEIDIKSLNSLSYYVNYNELKFYNRKKALKKFLKGNCQEIIKKFELEDGLMERNFFELEHWSYICSCIIGILKNKTIFCFPWIPEKEVRIQSYRFKILSEYALMNNLYIIIPTNMFDDYTKQHITYDYNIML